MNDLTACSWNTVPALLRTLPTPTLFGADLAVGGLLILVPAVAAHRRG
ncbi:hypothetical protein GII33_07190 [Gordonia pseudamarae]|uniref:Uncharacterized protein n=1 Tax=Gordonia pseudamarae TaxID=2831662 RepID=A0ABX6IFS8_9ACTN|nr:MULTISPECIES: hypothetical protein [Gordonia]MBD0020355.1 hypothetical protein [Gordonia sp. (in: high G+C Gram-positive bacteria)]QHN25780.1 hypothetical protein GII33_07190 [Gordonia pseudamarae]QHN34711.1 hypothetical protein GII31_07160 [Gordonia pseudamarae]